MSLSRWAVERPAALFLLVAVLCAAGVWSGMNLPSSIFPAVTFPRIKVIAEAAEEPAAQMVPAVTRPLEEALLRVPGIERVVSTTTRGSVELGAQFSWSTDVQLALQRVQAEIERTRPDLPPNVRVDPEWMNTAVFPILGYALTSTVETQAQLRELAEFRVKPELSQIPGVARSRSRAAACASSRCGWSRSGSPRATSPPPTSSTRSARATCCPRPASSRRTTSST
jgi:multidrug efflux pump subunit AcrB